MTFVAKLYIYTTVEMFGNVYIFFINIFSARMHSALKGFKVTVKALMILKKVSCLLQNNMKQHNCCILE